MSQSDLRIIGSSSIQGTTKRIADVQQMIKNGTGRKQAQQSADKSYVGLSSLESNGLDQQYGMQTIQTSMDRTLNRKAKYEDKSKVDKNYFDMADERSNAPSDSKGRLPPIEQSQAQSVRKGRDNKENG